MKLLFRWLINAIALLAVAGVVPGFGVDSFYTALIAALVLGLANALIRPILLILTLPINILTLGLFTFIINAMLLKMVSGLVSGFHVTGFLPAVFGSLLISIVSWLLNSFINDLGRIDAIQKDRRRRDPGSEDFIDLKQKSDDRWE